MKNIKPLGFAFFLVLIFLMSALPANAAGAEDGRADPRKVLEIGSKKDRSRIDYLRKLKLGREKQRHSAASNAQMALAKMGEKKEMDEIIAESKSDDPAIQAEAIEKLEYVGNKEAIQTLAGMLDDMRMRRGKPFKGADGKIHESDEAFGPPSHAAIKALSRIVSDGPKLKRKFATKDDVAAWKEWWSKNKLKYQ